MPTQIMWAQRNADYFTGFSHHHPGSLIGNRKNPILAGLAALGGVFPQPVSNLLGNENDPSLSAAFRLS